MKIRHIQRLSDALKKKILLIFGKLETIKEGELEIKSGLAAARVAVYADQEAPPLLSVSQLSLTVLAVILTSDWTKPEFEIQ